jgi:two-component system phosphate regulon sensor histidine kinase PhoR
LHKNSIDIPCEWGIFSVSHNKFIVQKSGNYKEELSVSQFVYRLFPYDGNENIHYLVLHFPSEKRYLFGEVINLLLLSILIILGIVTVYYVTIRRMTNIRKLTEMKSQFVKHITHELKTPIATISLVCEGLTDKTIVQNPEMLEYHLSIIKQENSKLNELCTRIINISKIESGKILLMKEDISVHTVLEEAMSNIELLVKKKSGMIVPHFDAENDVIKGDYVNLVDVFSNLIDNANKYNNTIPIIDIFTKNIANTIVITVKDNGIGIHRKNLKNIFNSFFRVSDHDDTHQVDGFGLGLNYVKLLVEKMGGKIEVESELNKGSNFIITFPTNS